MNDNKVNVTITDDEVEYICSKVRCPRVKEIMVNNPQLSLKAITHEGMLYISRMKWDRLTSINLSYRR
jgi:hypothetical protein